MAYNSKFTGAQIDALLDASETMQTSKEDVANKVKSLDAGVTDEQYPSAKAVKDAIATKENLTNKVTSINADADDDHYPSAKAVWTAIEDKFWYGIEKDTTVSTPTCTRIGNMEFHRTLPVHSLMRGCLLADDGTVNKYLDPDDWTSEVRDGSQGQVMVEIPRHFRKFETEGNIIRVKLSLQPLSGFHEVPKAYVSAYEATVDRSSTTNIKLCSVVNEGTNYRGGNNDSSLDGTYKSLLGCPASQLTRSQFRSYARNRNKETKEWNCYTYDVYVTLWWLFVTEYATLNSQATYNEELTADGYRQGGLGAGTTTLSDTQWHNYNSNSPFVKCGYTDSAGNKTTQAMYHIENDNASISLDVPVSRYRGVEHPFGHIWKIVDGIIVVISPRTNFGGDNTSKAYVTSDPGLFNDSNVSGYRLVGLELRDAGYVKKIQFGEFGDIVPTMSGAGTSTYYCDYYYTAIQTSEKKAIWDVGGSAQAGEKAGFLYVDVYYDTYGSGENLGSRLCFIPQK